jgi:protoheme IX farnesyltransferase
VTATDHPAARPAAGAPRLQGLRPRTRLLGFVALTKPRVIELLLMTTIPTMVLAQRGLPPLGLVAATVLGGALAAGSANALNCYVDRDIDMRMHRTERRPLVTGVVSPREALVFGVVLGLLSVGWLAVAVNPLSAALAAAAIAFYLFVYTLGLKRRSRQNIVWGGAAGCMPVLIGWSAVTGSLSWAPWVLFAVIFLWTPPHYWPLSIKYRRDYAAVGVPMLGAVASPVAVARQSVAYAWATVAATLVLVPVAGTGPLYAAAALGLGAWFVAEAHRLLRRARAAASADEVRAMRLFHVSISYLTLLFLAMAVDALLPAAWWASWWGPALASPPLASLPLA